MNRESVLPLSIEARRKRARQRQKLGELQVKLADTAAPAGEDEGAASDFVLLESLRVLRDLVELKGSHSQ